ncbi:MAG: hypothetical protein GY775_12715 [Candidatus Scalindua sp.]|nr:hypothetical protein [Candidatus Scalindua sp.]
MKATPKQKGKSLAWLLGSIVTFAIVYFVTSGFSLIPDAAVFYLYMLALLAIIVFIISAIRLVYLMVKK